MDTIAENAAKICGANDAVIRLVKENVLRTAAHYGPVPNVAEERPLDRQSPGGRAVLIGRSSTFPTWVPWCKQNFSRLRRLSSNWARNTVRRAADA